MAIRPDSAQRSRSAPACSPSRPVHAQREGLTPARPGHGRAAALNSCRRTARVIPGISSERPLRLLPGARSKLARKAAAPLSSFSLARPGALIQSPPSVALANAMTSSSELKRSTGACGPGWWRHARPARRPWRPRWRPRSRPRQKAHDVAVDASDRTHRRVSRPDGWRGANSAVALAQKRKASASSSGRAS